MFAGKTYCPVLYTRRAEIKALTQLSGVSKNLIFPLVVARPWPNAKHLVRTWEKIAEAFGDRPFALDLDRFSEGRPSSRPAAAEFDALFARADGYASYYGQLHDIPNAIPVLRTPCEISELSDQLDWVESLNRGLVLRIEQASGLTPMSLVEAVLERRPDTAIFVDLGWSNDILNREVWASQILRRLGEIQPELEIVVCGSSFPDAFAKNGQRKPLPVVERSIFARLVREHNALSLVYGDWGGTRQPKDPTPARIVPRIELPQRQEWVSFRSDSETWADVAQRIVTDTTWSSAPKIWGTYIIESTANEQPGAINSPEAAASARINIHLHMQTHFDEPQVVSDGEEPFTDDL